MYATQDSEQKAADQTQNHLHTVPATPIAPAGLLDSVLDALVLPTISERLNAIGEETILRRLANAESLRAIAQSYSIDIGSLRWWIERDTSRSARARAVRCVAAAAWDELAQEVIESAADPFELAKAKELAHHYRWRASKIAPKIYGDKVFNETTVKLEVDITQHKDHLRQLLDINPHPSNNIALQHTMKSVEKHGVVSHCIVQCNEDHIIDVAADEPRKPMTNAERQAAYRARKAASRAS